MGGELVDDSSSQPKNKSDTLEGALFLQYTKIFEDIFPLYLSLGMTYEQYWEQDCELTTYYLKAHRLKEERELMKRNHEAWLQGAYIYQVLCNVAPIYHAFASRGTKPSEYIKQPFPLTKEDQEELEENKRIERLERAKERFMNSVIRK